MAHLESPPAKFRLVYQQHHAAVRNYCFRRLAPSDANDATAEVFLVVWRRLGDVPQGDDALPFLFGIARKVVANARRANSRRRHLNGRLRDEPGLRVADPGVQVVQRDEVARVLRALSLLSETDQELLRLKAWEKLTSRQIAAATGLSVRAVETRISRARKRLARGADPTSPSHRVAALRLTQRGGER